MHELNYLLRSVSKVELLSNLWWSENCVKCRSAQEAIFLLKISEDSLLQGGSAHLLLWSLGLSSSIVTFIGMLDFLLIWLELNIMYRSGTSTTTLY